jgi:hypothetical protein
MNLSAALTLTGQDNPSRHFETFTQTIDLSLIQQALSATGTASIRNRKLPADRVIFLIIGMALFRNISIQAVCDHLHLTLPHQTLPNQTAQSQSIRSSSLTQARDRLGIEPLKNLFELLTSKFTLLAHKMAPVGPFALEHTKFDTWRGLTIFGMDGSTMCVPDSIENREHFGVPANGNRGESAYPQARLVGLMRLGSHRLTGLNIGKYSQGEVSLAEPLYALIPDQSVLIVDRGFLSWPRFWHHHQGGQQRHWLIRAKSNLRWKVIKELGPGDQLVEIKFTHEARKADPILPATMQARVIAYQIPGFQPERLVTSLTDAILFPAVEVVGLYHERWEFELGLDEIKTHTLERVETVRSSTPDRVRQELWGLAITYNVVRQEMARIASVLGVPALRLSYRWCLLLFRNLWSSAWVVASGLIPRHLEQLLVDVENLLLPERRRGRRNPRAVKVKMSGYAKKRRAGAA